MTTMEKVVKIDFHIMKLIELFRVGFGCGLLGARKKTWKKRK